MQAAFLSLVLALLPRVALAVERVALLQRIIELGKEEPADADSERLITIFLKVPDLSLEERAQLLPSYKAEGCDCIVFPPTDDTLVITDVRSAIERVLRRLLEMTLAPSPRPAGRGSG